MSDRFEMGKGGSLILLDVSKRRSRGHQNPFSVGSIKAGPFQGMVVFFEGQSCLSEIKIGIRKDVEKTPSHGLLQGIESRNLL